MERIKGGGSDETTVIEKKPESREIVLKKEE